MTLTMAWVRAQGDVEELIVASDSRVRSGLAWDAAPKILPLTRGDSVLAFAGSTIFAYPMMLQAANAVMSYDRAGNRALALEELRGHLIRVLNGMLAEISDEAEESLREPDALFLFAGFSWRHTTWRIWTLRYDRRTSAFNFETARRKNDKRVLAIVGDSVPVARQRLRALVHAGGRPAAVGFDWEPLQVLTGMIHDGRFPTIGGPPQVVKVYRYLRVQSFAIPWRRPDGTLGLSLLGRPLLSYEAPDIAPTLPMDPSTGEVAFS